MLMAGCGAPDDSSATDTLAPPTTINATSPSSPDDHQSTSVPMTVPDPTTLASIEPTIDTARLSDEAKIVAATAAYRIDNNGELGDILVDRINVIDQYATQVPEGYLVVGDDGRLLDSTVRQAVEGSLAPANVMWFHTPDDALGNPSGTDDLPTYEDIGLILTFGAPEIDGSNATIVSEMWCGMACGGGTTFTLERSDTGEWVVTGTTGNGWVA